MSASFGHTCAITAAAAHSFTPTCTGTRHACGGQQMQGHLTQGASMVCSLGSMPATSGGHTRQERVYSAMRTWGLPPSA